MKQPSISKEHNNYAPKGVAYIRVSDLAGRVEDDILSPDSAIDAAEKYFAAKGIPFDVELSRNNQDINVSAFKEDTWLKRKGLNNLLEAAKRGEFTHLAFFAVSRLARNLQDGFAIIGAFKKVGVTCHFMSDPLPESESPAFDIVLASLLWSANQHSKAISVFTKAAIEQKRKRGLHHGTLVSWLSRNENGTLILDPYWSPIYRLIVDMSLSGVSTTKIAKQMNALGYKRPKGDSWTQKSIYDALKGVYLEKMAGWDHIGKDRLNEKIQRIFPPLITDEEYNRLDLLYNTRRETLSFNLRAALRAHSPHGTKIATGIVKCLVCNRTIKGAGSQVRGDRGRIHRYMCMCGKAITGPTLEDAIIRTLRKFLEDRGDQIDPTAQLENNDLPEPKTNVSDIEKQMEVLLDMHLAGRVPTDLYDRKMAALVEEKADIEKVQTNSALPDLAAMVNESSSDQVWRSLALTAISSATYPHTVPLRDKSRNIINYKAVRIVTATGKTYLAPLYRENFQGPRLLVEAE